MKENILDPEWYKSLPDSEWLLSESASEKEGKEIADHFFTHPGMTVFDCPCGDGRISIHLARKGAFVTGLDLNIRFVKQAQERFSKEGLESKFSIGDMRDAMFEGGCDLFLSWFNSFGYFTDKENRKFMQTIANCIKPGGRLVMENPILKKSNFKSKVSDNSNIIEHYVDEGNRLVIVVYDEQTKKEYYSSERLYSKEEYESMFEDCGMKLIEAYSEGLTPYSEDKKRMILVAEKL